MRKYRWLELLKDYNVTILYHLSKSNVIGNTLSWKVVSMGSMAFLLVEELPLASDILCLARQMIQLDISEMD